MSNLLNILKNNNSKISINAEGKADIEQIIANIIQDVVKIELDKLSKKYYRDIKADIDLTIK